MELKSAFLAQSAEVLPDQRLFVFGGGIFTITVQTLPATLPAISIVTHFHFATKECGADYNVTLEIRGPIGSIYDLTLQHTLRPDRPATFPERGADVFVAIGINNLIFDLTGLWSFNFFSGTLQLGGFRVAVERL